MISCELDERRLSQLARHFPQLLTCEEKRLKQELAAALDAVVDDFCRRRDEDAG